MYVDVINEIYYLWVYILQVLGGSPGEFGMGYYIVNILIFAIIQPGLILLFFLLWIKQRKTNKKIQLQSSFKDTK
jgi:hypothetical protein